MPSQFTRYLRMAGEADSRAPGTSEDTVEDPEAPPVDTAHKNYDAAMEECPPGTHFLAEARAVPGCKRRNQSRLGCTRTATIEPFGPKKEDFYEAKLLLGFSVGLVKRT